MASDHGSRPFGRLGAYVGSVLPDDSLGLQDRLYGALCVLAAALSFVVVIPLNLIQRLPTVINVAGVGFGLFSIGLAWAARRGHSYPTALLAGLLVTLNIGWFPNAGSHGSIAYYFFAAIGLPLIFFEGWKRVALFAIVVLNAVGLLLVEAAWPRLVQPFHSEYDRMLDLGGNIVTAAATCALMLWVVISGYLHERERLKATLAELAESEARLSTLIDGTDDLVWLVDAREHRLTAFNTAFAEAAREHPGIEVAPGLLPEDIMPPDVAAEWHGHFERALTEGPFTLEYSVPGTSTVMLHSFTPVRHGATAVGVSVFGKDITERKRAEQEKERVEQQVFESQRLESLGRLAGGVAHDFNNMLAGIMGHADLLLEQETDRVRREHLVAVLNAAKRSAALTTKLLAFGRRGRNLVESVDVNTVVGDGVAMLGPSFPRDVQIVTRLKSTWPIDGDPSQINQIVVNLCINAVDAMPRGGTLTLTTGDALVDDELSLEHGIPQGDYVALRVTDSGVGMTDEVRARIFEPFFTTKTQGAQSGTGLGLATVHGIVHSHRGAIAVSSAPDEGTTFTVWLPKGQLVPADKPSASPARRGHGCILVVDDEPQLRRVATLALARLGYRTLTAEDGDEAVRVFGEYCAEITGVLLDLKMPHKGGYEAFLEIHALAPDVPVLICSGYGDNDEAQSLITLGAKGLLSKPFRLAELADQLSKLG